MPDENEDTTTETETSEIPTEKTTSQETDKALGEKGEKALEAWKERAKAAEADAKETADLRAKLAEIEAANMTEHEAAIAAAREEADTAARTDERGKANTRLFRAEVKAAATEHLSDPDLLSDPAVAVTLLGLTEIPVTETGDIDAEAISAAVVAFAEAKPHLAVSATRPAPITQGARQHSTGKDPGEMTPAEYIEHQRSQRRSA